MKNMKIFVGILGALIILVIGCEQTDMTVDPLLEPSAEQEFQVSVNTKNPKNGPHRKVTGDVGWYAGGADRTAVFTAHDNAPGKCSDRGTIYYVEDAPGLLSTFKGSLDFVDVISETKAKFCGTMFETTGRYKVGTRFCGFVEDGGSPGVGNDKVQFLTGDCNAAKWIINSGNLTIHY